MSRNAIMKCPPNQPSNTNDLEKVARQLLEEDHEGETLLQIDFPVPDNIPDQAAPQAMEKSPPRRSARVRKTRQRYIEVC